MDKGIPKEEILNKNIFSAHIHPAYWIQAFLPNQKYAKCDVTFWADHYTEYTRTMAILSNTVQPHNKYSNLKNFTIWERDKKFTM